MFPRCFVWCVFSVLSLACIAGCTVNPQISGLEIIRDVNCVAWNAQNGEKATVYGVVKRQTGGLQFVFPRVSNKAKSPPLILAEAKMKPLPGKKGEEWYVFCAVPRETIPLAP